MSQCCLSGYEWDGKPTGKETKLGNNDAYVVGSNKEVRWFQIIYVGDNGLLRIDM